MLTRPSFHARAIQVADLLTGYPNASFWFISGFGNLLFMAMHRLEDRRSMCLIPGTWTLAACLKLWNGLISQGVCARRRLR